MSWLARSLTNSLKPVNYNGQDPNHELTVESPGRGVKDDLSELTKTFSRQLWGVASFLAPPPSSENHHSSSISDPSQNPSTEPSISSRNSSETGSDIEKVADPRLSGSEAQDSPRMAGIRNDFAEIGGKFKIGLSRFSTNKAVSEISKLASSFLPFGSEEENVGDRGGWGERSAGGAVGVTDEVLVFARNISMHPETWVGFSIVPR